MVLVFAMFKASDDQRSSIQVISANMVDVEAGGASARCGLGYKNVISQWLA